MKKWRRSASIAGSGATGFPPVAPVVISIVADVPDGVYVVTFDQTVTYDGVGTGTMQIGIGPGSWDAQLSSNSLEWAPGSGISAAGTAWHWAAPDTSLSPVPSSSQTGTTT